MTKRKFVLTICLAMMGVLGMKAQYGIVALHHEGNVTLYAGGLIQEAMNASVKGDTLYLSEGTFAGFNVSHDIVVLGSGEKTVLTTDIVMGTTNGNPTKYENLVFCGLNLLTGFKIRQIVTERFIVQQCKMEEYDAGSYSVSNIRGAKIEFCVINKRLNLSSSMYELEVIASKINEVYNEGAYDSAVNFHYCNISICNGSVDSRTQKNTFVNSIIGNARYATLMNSLYKERARTNGIQMDSWEDTDWSFDEDMNCSYSDEELKSKGYISTEGTVVGITGWQTPFTLEPFYPHVIDHTLDVDNVNKTLKVTLKMNE